MTREEKQLLIKDLCARLPYGVKLLCANGEVVTLVNPPIAIQDDRWNFKPYLRPMSGMTEEEVKEEENTVMMFLADFYYAHYLDFHGLIPKGLALEAPDGMYKT